MQRSSDGTSSYEEFEASELFCSTCGRSNPVRRNLLIVLPTGNKYDYRCAVCGASVGTKTDDDNRDFRLILPGQGPSRP